MMRWISFTSPLSTTTTIAPVTPPPFLLPHFSAKHLTTINRYQRHVYVRTCLSSFFICLPVCCLVCALLYAVLALALYLSCRAAVACSLDRCVWVVWWLVLCRSVVPLWFKLCCCCVIVVVQHVLLLPSLLLLCCVVSACLCVQGYRRCCSCIYAYAYAYARHNKKGKCPTSTVSLRRQND